jgi:hypothetical protein
METRKTPRPPDPRKRKENQNIQPFTMDKMTARRVFPVLEVGENVIPDRLCK